MIDPYQVLDLSPQANAEMIRRRYLELVRRHSPERDPERFAEIRAAYDQLRDPVVSLERRLFGLSASGSLDSLIAEKQVDVRARRLPTSLLMSLGKP